MAVLAGVGIEFMGLVEFIQKLPQKGKGKDETIWHWSTNKNQSIYSQRSEFQSMHGC
jgi:hypothetical protein